MLNGYRQVSWLAAAAKTGGFARAKLHVHIRADGV